MVVLLMALVGIALVSVVMFVLKMVLKLSFSFGKILILLLGVWLIFGFVTGGIQETFDHLGKPYVETREDGSVHYTAAFSTGELDLTDLADGASQRLLKAEINAALSKVKIVVPQGCVLKINRKCALVRYGTDEEKGLELWTDEESVIGSGNTIIEIKLLCGLADIEIELR